MNWKGILIGFLLVFIDLLCFIMTNIIYKYQYSPYYLVLIMIVFSIEIPLFYWALHNNSMVVINFIWSALSIIGIMVAGFIIYHNSYTPLSITAIVFASISIILFLFTNKTQYDVIL